MLMKLIRYIGTLIIILFSAFCVILATQDRELLIGDNLDSATKKILSAPGIFEERFFDYRMQYVIKDQKGHDDIVLAAIDENSLNKTGRWPWSRTTWARFMSKMKNYGAKIIAFDVVFSEPEEACNQESPDNVFAKSIKSFESIPGNKVILPYSLGGSGVDPFKEVPHWLYNYIIDSKLGGENIGIYQSTIPQSTFPIDTLADTEAGLGYIGAHEDTDGIFRHYPVLANIDGLYFPSFGLLSYQLFTGDMTTFQMENQDLAFLKTKKGDIKLNLLGETKIRWRGAMDKFSLVSIQDILDSNENDQTMKNKLNGKMVFIGSTAFGAHDLRHTPVGGQTPGIYLHLNLVDMLLTGNYYQPKNESTTISWWMLIIGTLIMVTVMFFKNPLLDVSTMILVVSGMLYYDITQLTPFGYEIKLFFCIFSVVSNYSWETFLSFYVTNKEKSKIRGTFSRYVAPAIVDQMLAHPDQVKIGGEKKNITVFFSDVRDFTTISEKLTPEQLSHCLNRYMGVMTKILFDNYGTLDKYIGDAIVGFWGAPVEVKDHAYYAIKASLAMIEALPAINEEFERDGYPLFKFGIGLNTGDCSVGNMGSDLIFNYTALGDHMNLGARLEGLCKFYGVQLNISEFTLAALSDEQRQQFKIRMLDKVRVKGKEKAVTIYEVLHNFHPFYTDIESFEIYHTAFELYLNKQFDKAREIFNSLHEKYTEDKSCKRMLEYCQNYLENPPNVDWDGVITFTTK